MSAVAVVSVAPVTAEEPGDAALASVLGVGAAAAGLRAGRLAALLDPGFLAEAGWDPVTWLLAPETEHRLIRWDGSGRRPEAPARREPPGPAIPAGKCAVTACLRERRARRGREETRCALHARRWEAALLADPGLDGRRWNERAEPVPVTGQVNLRGLAPLAVVEMLYGVQQRVRAGCTSYCRTLRVLARELRQAQAPSLADLPAQEEKGRQGLLNSLTMHAGRAFADPRSEIAKDRWDLTVLGHHGWLDFTRISQEWLRESVKAWAAHDLPRRRGKQAGARLHEITGAMIRLSATLRAGKGDRGEDPAALGRADVEAFLHRLAFLTADGQMSAYCRVKTCQDAGRVLKGIRSLGLTRAAARPPAWRTTSP